MQALHQFKLEDAKERLEKDKDAYVDSVDMAFSYLSVKDKDKAIEWLNRAYDERHNRLLWLKVEPRWNPLRDDPRFKELVNQVGIPE